MSRNIKKLVVRTSVGMLFFATSCACGYMLTPMNKKNIDLGNNNIFTNVEDTSSVSENFMKFVTRLNNDTGLLEDEIDEENIYYGFNIGLDDFSISFKKDENSAANNILVNGDVDFMMKTIKDITFNVDVDVDYNGKEVPLELGYVNKTAYFGLKDLRMKVSSTTIDELFGNEDEGNESLLYQVFIASKEEGGIGFDLERLIDDLVNDLVDNKIGGMVNGLDLSSLASNLALKELEEGEEGFGIKVTETEIASGYKFNLDLQIRNESMDKEFTVVLNTDEDYRLKRVEINNADFGNVQINGAIDIQTIANYHIIAPDHEDYRHADRHYNYVEVINYKGWLQKIANFIEEGNQKFGLDFTFDLDEKDENGNLDIGVIEGSINADFSKLIDLGEYFEEPTRSAKRGLFDSEAVSNIRNKVSLGVDLRLLGQNNEEYTNLSISYIEGKGYLKLNETETNNGKRAVVKSMIDTDTMNWIIDTLPGMFANMSGDGTSSEAVAELFSFVTDSSFVNGIKSGDYSVALDLLKDLKNDENSFEISLDLSSLGFGDEAEVGLVLDSRLGAQNKVLNLEANNVEMGSYVLNASINTEEFRDIIVEDDEAYDSLSFLPTVFDQVYNIIDTKQTGFVISGSVLDDNGVGIKMNGKGQFDLGSKYGFGDLTIDQYKYSADSLYYSHKLAIDVDNTTSDYVKNNAHFVYGEKTGKNIKGKVTVQSVLDIIDIGKEFLDENKDNPKFTKFIEPITKMMSMGEFGNIINSKDYLRLLKNDLVSSMKRTGDQLDLVICGALFDIEGDMTVRVNLKDDKLDSLEFIDLAISGKKLNVKVTLVDYDPLRESSVDKSNMNSFMDLSSIAVLLKFGINTTKNNYYHLTADVNLNLGVIQAVDFRLEIYIVVKDSYCKIYGVIEDSRMLFAVQKYNDLTTSSLKSEFTFETYADDDPNRLDGVGGYFHFKVTEKRRLSGTRIYHYKTTSKNFLESNNIVKYLLSDFLYMRDWVVDEVGGIDLSSSEQKPAGDFTNTFTSTGFSYNASQKKWSTGLNLNELTGVDALKDLEVDIYGNSSEKLSRLNGKLNIEALKLGSLSTMIKIGFNVALEQTSSSVTDWSNSLQSAFDTINSVAFSSAYLNNPDKPLSK